MIWHFIIGLKFCLLQGYWLAIERVIRYLIDTKNYGILYKKYPVVIETFSDANWITLSGDSLSTTGYIFTLGTSAICWNLKSKQ